ncbi:hypothetical protein LO762_02445 [Actinocorallia sp. API 0066]|uniref:hypothetical protein n=1 Tax=Actinocorallia sp. API 0066 TaxID=2896846 RepID=UPI001E3F507E|nr:hypothetical protein [Actinocorallia sp. API 0066]MCD0448061.1 hypothetical protein [Actinocorallia sp. API 0066]
MSEIMVSKTHIDALLTAALRWSDPADPYGPLGALSFFREDGGSVYLTAENAHELGRALLLYHFDMCDWDEGREEAEAYTFEALPGKPDPVVILRGIEFYEYQTAPEVVEEWSETTTYKFLTALRFAAIGQLPDIRRVPWGLDERDVFLEWAARARPNG